MKTSVVLIIGGIVLAAIWMLSRMRPAVAMAPPAPAPSSLPVGYPQYGGGVQTVPMGGMSGDQQLAGQIVGGVLQAASSVLGAAFSSGAIGGGDYTDPGM